MAAKLLRAGVMALVAGSLVIPALSTRHYAAADGVASGFVVNTDSGGAVTSSVGTGFTDSTAVSPMPAVSAPAGMVSADSPSTSPAPSAPFSDTGN